MSQTETAPEIEAEVIETSLAPIQSTALQQIEKAEIDMQITTAKRFPRSLDLFKKRALSMATFDQETATSCTYALPRKDNESGKTKMLKGPTIRLAEIVAAAYGNIRYGSNILDTSGDVVVARGYVMDLENNVGASVECRRRIVNKHGKRYTDDMIVVTSNAAAAVALRNAIFKAIPAALARPIWLEAQKVAAGDTKTLQERRKSAFESFKSEFKLKQDQVLRIIGKTGPDDIGLEDLTTLFGVLTALRDGDTTVDELLSNATATAADIPTGRNSFKNIPRAQSEPVLTPEEKTELVQGNGNGAHEEGPLDPPAVPEGSDKEAVKDAWIAKLWPVARGKKWTRKQLEEVVLAAMFWNVEFGDLADRMDDESFEALSAWFNQMAKEAE